MRAVRKTQAHPALGRRGARRPTDMPQYRSGRGRGFTLVELVTVMLIIGILGAILFPVFARARQKGWQASCIARLVNICGALRIYAADCYGAFPPDPPGLGELAELDLITTRQLACPTAGAAGLRGMYLYRSGLFDDSPPNEAVACDTYRDVHNGGSNFAFVDGHAKWFSETDLDRWAKGKEPEEYGPGIVELIKRQRPSRKGVE